MTESLKAAFLTLGCKVNQYETDAMRELLEAAGYDIVDFKERADVYIINTCSVTNMADRKSRQMIHRARKKNPDAVVVAAGCYVQAAENELKEKGIADVLIGNNKKKDIVRILEEYFQKGEKKQKGKEKTVENGVDTGYSEEEATRILSEKEVTAIADIKQGTETATAWGCDLTYDYVRINGDYRS